MKFIINVALILSSAMAFAAPLEGIEALKYLPVQDGGRVKPYDTLARETLQLIYGSQTYNGRPAVEVVTTWLLVPEYWDKQKIVQVVHPGLKEALKLNVEEKFFTPTEVFASERLAFVLQELNSFRKGRDKLTPYLQAVQRLEGQIGTYHAFKAGTLLQILPPTKEEIAAGGMVPPTGRGMAVAPDKWKTAAEMDPASREIFMQMVRAFVRELPQRDGTAELTQKVGVGDVTQPSLKDMVARFKDAARARNSTAYPPAGDMWIEVHIHEFHPFLWSWVIYLLGAILMAFAWHSGRPRIYHAAWACGILGFLLHTYGFGIRIYITGRPPVSNMYESVVWVCWGAMIFAFIFEYLYRHRFILLAGMVVGVLSLIVADTTPTVLDKSMQPLEPVLRSNLWLTVHVLTITLSYSAFFLAWGLGNFGLGYFLRGKSATSPEVRDMSTSIYRSIQVGVVLLAAGTILGGVWADYSWGRFWGWDPKETWALIALLGYLAVLHARLVGWVQNFGMMFCAVISFNLVIMAWYGVNFVLGAGKHSYGFGAGGLQYVAGFIGLNFLYVIYVAFVKRAFDVSRVK